MKTKPFVPVTGSVIQTWANAMITQDQRTREFILWETTDYQHGREIKRMGDFERLRHYSARYDRVKFDTRRQIPPSEPEI